MHTSLYATTLAIVICGMVSRLSGIQVSTSEMKLVALTEIGGEQGGAFPLSVVQDLAVGPDGTIYVLQPQDRVIRAFGTDGRLLREIGRGGRGPGEFDWPLGLGVSDDLLWVWDSGVGRVSLFARNGEFLESITVMQSGIAAVLRDRALLVLSESGAFARYRNSGNTIQIDTIAQLPGFPQPGRLTIPVGDRSAVMAQPFSEVASWDVIPGGDLVIANRMVESQPPTFRVTRITSQGDTVFSRFYPYEPVTTPDAAVDAAARRITENIRRASQGNVNVPVGYVRSRLFVPDHLGPITDLSVGDGSAIWIRREDSGEGPVVWEILDGSGRKRGFVRVPRELDIEWATLSDAWAVGGTQSGAPLITRFAVRASP